MAVQSAVTESTKPKEAGFNPFRLLKSWEPYVSAIFLLLNFALGLFWFILLVTLIPLGVGLAITLIGIPILVLTMIIWRGGAMAERWRFRFMFDDDIPEPYKDVPEGSFWTRIKTHLSDGATWLDLAYLLLLFPIGTAEFVILTVAAAAPLWLISIPTHYWASKPEIISNWRIDTLPEALAACAAGLVLLPIGVLLIVAMTRGHRALAKWMLGGMGRLELTERVETLTKTRSDVIEAQLDERQRIERDLHDGVQPRLVTLAMDLGMAKEKMENDPVAAQKLLAESHEEAKQVLSELRGVIRGIHPAVLTDRGLDAAISGLASRAPVPVDVDIDLPGRLPEAVESTAYFIVAESLTNVAKHSQATEARVWVRVMRGLLLLEIVDNGVGGATAETGGGLAGLGSRVAALDGRLLLESPAGGPTIVRAEIPCGS
ncbi:MAG: sensor histidine kinase [Thermomicrobiales bacterium]